MLRDKSLFAIVLLLVLPVVLLSAVFSGALTPQTHVTLNQISEDPIQPSFPTNVVIRESAIYDAPIGEDRPIVHFEGVVYWEELAGAGLNFFINTTDVIKDSFYDFETKAPMDMRDACYDSGGYPITNCVQDQGDRYLIVPDARSFGYKIDAYYDPDIVQDTGFIVIFNSQSVDFSITIDGEQRYANTDYENRIVLPKGAGIVSYAPIDEGFQGIELTNDGRWALSWKYVNREMDSKHDPLMISVTYAFDDIFLAFTEQVYQNQQEKQKQQQEINKLNLIQQSFVIIATLAIVASLFSVLFAYLLARRRFQPQLERAKELPRREASDIEDSPSLKVPIKSLFLSGMILVPLFFAPGFVHVTDAQVTEQDHVIWKGTYDLRRDLTLTESADITLPVQRDTIRVYTNTSRASNFAPIDEYGNPLQYETASGNNYFLVINPGFEFSYSFDRPYTVSNNSQMLVWLDRVWLEFRKPAELNPPQDDLFFHVDLTYSVILPKDAILYSASPSDLLTITRNNPGGRTNVTFTDTNRQMDAFHDVFETQVTFSFVNIFDALENLNTDFFQVKAQQQDLNSLIQVAATEILLFSLLGLIAPLISFFIAYWVFRRRYMKQIERAEKEQEEKIFIEEPQLLALAQSIDKNAGDRLYDAYKGQYFRVMSKLSKLLDKDVNLLDEGMIMNEIMRKDIKVDQERLMEVLSMGKSIQPEDSIGYSQLNEFTRMVEEVLEDLN